MPLRQNLPLLPRQSFPTLLMMTRAVQDHPIPIKNCRPKNQATKFDTQDKLIAHLQGEIKKGQGLKEITVYAPGDISAGTSRTLVTSIEKSFGKDEISKIHLGVTGKK